MPGPALSQRCTAFYTATWQRSTPCSPVAARQVREALALAYDSHSGQDRKSGEPYITHPVEVTRILAELRMDYESLIAGLLHDTVEDTNLVTFEEIGVRLCPRSSTCQVHARLRQPMHACLSQC